MRKAPPQPPAVVLGVLVALGAALVAVAVVVNYNVGRSFFRSEVADHWKPSDRQGRAGVGAAFGVPNPPPEALAERLRAITVVIVARTFDPKTRVATRTLGAGFFVTPKRVLTSAALVEGADQVTVVAAAASRAEVRGRVVVTNPDTDLALVAVSGAGTVAPLRDSTRQAVGDRLFFVGNQVTQGATFTSGLLVGRRQDVVVDGRRFHELWLFTDAAGGSAQGGPLANAAGEVVAIHVVTSRATVNNELYGYALPINEALPVLLGARSRT